MSADRHLDFAGCRPIHSRCLKPVILLSAIVLVASASRADIYDWDNGQLIPGVDWSTGDWDAEAKSDFSDRVVAFEDGGYHLNDTDGVDSLATSMSDPSAIWFEPTPYLSAENLPSGFKATNPFIEDFEDGAVDSRLTIAPGKIIGPGYESGIKGVTDSVDADDGMIDGDGRQGHSFFFALNEISVEFATPMTSAGLVFTDGPQEMELTLEAFNRGGDSIGAIRWQTTADEVFTGTTTEDRFIGLTNLDGISRLKIGQSGPGLGIEIDHIAFSVIPDTDGDGLLDLVDTPTFDPSVSDIADFAQSGIEDLDGANQLTDVRELLLGENKITRIEEGDFRGLTNLQTLIVQRNQISSVEIAAFQGLTNLDLLDLGGNQIGSIENGSFQGLTNLQSLNLLDNRITSIENGAFQELAKLNMLGLVENQITSIERADFQGLANLQFLALRRNEIKSIESGVFQGLTNLDLLDLGGNQLSSIESAALQGLTNLDLLDLSGNQLTSIACGTFQELSNLSWLALGDNPITRLEAGSFKGLNNLRVLDLSGNQISSIQSGTFQGLTKLESLMLVGNNIEELNFTNATFESLLRCDRRSGLCLDAHRVTKLILDGAVLNRRSFDTIVAETASPSMTDVSLVGLTFSNQAPTDLSNLLGIRSLENVTVDQSLFHTYSDSFHSFATNGNTVTVVPGLCDVDRNGICGVDDINAMTKKMITGVNRKADYVALIKRPVPHGFGTYFGDANLDGRFNSRDLVAVFEAGKYEQDVLATWSEGDWNADARFGTGDLVAAFGDGGYELDADGDGLLDTDGDGLLDLVDTVVFDPSARTANFRQLGVEDLDGAHQLTKLRELLLGDNEIASIESADFQGLTKLNILILGRNQIRSIESGAFQGLTNLDLLDLGGNQITSIESGTFQGLTNLNVLSLWKNQITSIESRAFQGLTNLEILELGRNRITSIENGTFQGLTKLESLMLVGNRIEELNFTQATFESLRRCDNRTGLCIDPNEITELILDDAVLNLDSFDVIVAETASTSLTDVSLVGLTFSDQVPSNLSNLLGISSLDNVTVDQALFDAYGDEFSAFAAIDGNTVTVVPRLAAKPVPEPASAALFLVGLIGLAVCLWRVRR